MSGGRGMPEASGSRAPALTVGAADPHARLHVVEEAALQAPAPAGADRQAPDLRRVLVACDTAAALVGWMGALVVAPAVSQGAVAAHVVGERLVAATLLTGATLALIGGQRLWLARGCTIKTLEHLRLMRAVAGAGLAGWVASAVLAVSVPAGAIIAGGVVTLVGLFAGRGGYRAWLGNGRSVGRFTRPVVVVASGADQDIVCDLLAQNPELGYRVTGVVGPVDAGDEAPRARRIIEAVQASGASGAIVAANALPSEELNRTVRALLDAGIHVQLWTGLQGITRHRLRYQPLAHEPFFYVEQQSRAAWQLAAKRTLDVAGAVFGLVLALPVLAVSAVAIKAHDRGPVLFRQQRVGRHGQQFTLYKLRSMVPDAEGRLELLRDRNERTGPLFKLADDPRTTPVGRFLRAAHIDELPQLVNVLQGRMSLVGPRPCLPAEEHHFGEELRARREALPGITGLWQVESNDKPHFDSYQRLDLFYIENWTVGLDVAILLATVERLTVRFVAQGWARMLRTPRSRRARLEPAHAGQS